MALEPAKRAAIEARAQAARVNSDAEKKALAADIRDLLGEVDAQATRREDLENAVSERDTEIKSLKEQLKALE